MVSSSKMLRLYKSLSTAICNSILLPSSWSWSWSSYSFSCNHWSLYLPASVTPSLFSVSRLELCRQKVPSSTAPASCDWSLSVAQAFRSEPTVDDWMDSREPFDNYRNKQVTKNNRNKQVARKKERKKLCTHRHAKSRIMVGSWRIHSLLVTVNVVDTVFAIPSQNKVTNKPFQSILCIKVVLYCLSHRHLM